MVCKEELCKWFKNLRPHQRIDYMCGLLHMCLPLELRFLGSVLEDHGKKNYNFLRDAELKANNCVEISKLYSGTDKQVRATVSVYLSLLHSSNTPCAQLLYEVLEKNLERAFTFGTDPNDNEEILMALTLAINHPAFQFHQKNILYEHYARYNPEVIDRRNKNTEAFDLYEEAPLIVNSPTVDERLRERIDCISNIELKDLRKPSGKKFELKILVTWSNGEVYEVTKTMREMHDLYMRLKELFPEEADLQKREWKSTFQGHYHGYSHSHTHKEDQGRNVTSYFSLLLRLPATLKHEQVLEFFKGGRLVQQGTQEPVVPPAPRIPSMPLPPMSVNTGEEHGIPPFPLKSLTVCNSQLHPCPQNFLVSSDPNMRLPRCNSSDYLTPTQRLACPHGVVPHLVDSPSHSPTSSVTDSPHNSRSTSPSHNSDVCTETIQLLQLLNLEQYADSLGKLTLKQLKSQSSEDLSKAGLPREAQHKLRSKLENINREKTVPSVNGLVDGSSSGGTLSPASPNSIPWNQTPFFLPQHVYHPIYLAQSPASTAPPAQPEVADTSPHDSEVSSPPSPTQICIQKAKTDSSGSDDNDKDKSNCSEPDKARTDGRRKFYSNRTLLQQQRGPQLSHHLADEMKGGMVRQPSPLNFASDLPPAPTAATMSTYNNGYQSDPNPSPVTSATYPPRPAYYPHQMMRPMKPSPAHTNMSSYNKNIINMPQEGHIKPPLMMYYQGAIRTDIPMTTSVVPMNMNNNTVTNQTFSANNEGVNSSQRHLSYMSVMSRPIIMSSHRSVPANLNSAPTVTVSQGGAQPMAGGHSPGPANISVKPNGVLPIPNPSGTPPESVHSGSDSPLQMHHGQSTGSTTVTFSTATSTFSGTPQTAVSSASHTQCSSCGCNCSSGTSSLPSYQPPYNTIPYPVIMPASFMNGMMNPFNSMAAYGHHVPPPSYPNGISHEMYNHPGFPHMHPAMAPQLIHNSYGSLHHSQGNPGAHVKHKQQGCYNCGSSQHKAQDCKETSMDGISGNYHLNYKPKSDSD